MIDAAVVQVSKPDVRFIVQLALLSVKVGREERFVSWVNSVQRQFLPYGPAFVISILVSHERAGRTIDG